LNDVLRIDVCTCSEFATGHEVNATFNGATDDLQAAAVDRAAALGRSPGRREFRRRWMAATMSRDVQTMLNMVEMPF
jgi:hypothetical protein